MDGEMKDMVPEPSRAERPEGIAQPQELESLIARVEAAEGSDPQLCADILNALGDQAIDRGKLGWTWRPAGVGIWHNLPDLTRSLDAALALKERVLPGFHVLVSSSGAPPAAKGPHSGWRASLKGDYDFVSGQPRTSLTTPVLRTPALALCLALLRALAAGQSLSENTRDGSSPHEKA